MDRRQQGSPFTIMHEAAGEPPTGLPPHPPPSISGQAPGGYTNQGISFTPITFPVGIVSSSSPRDGLNDLSPPDHASKNSLSSQDVQLSVKHDGHQGEGEGVNPHVSPDHSDMAGAPERGVFPSAAPIIRFPKASAKQNVRAPEQRLSANSNPGYENSAYLGPGQIRLTSGGVINLAMDDPIGEEPAEVRAMRGSRPPVGSTSGFSGAHGTGIHSPMQNMAMGRQVEKEGCCGGRPLFGLWIGICVFLCFCTLFFGLVPLIFFWQAREEWDSGNTAKAKKSLRLAWISFLVALLVLTGGVAGLAIQVHLSQQAVDKAYREARLG